MAEPSRDVATIVQLLEQNIEANNPRDIAFAAANKEEANLLIEALNARGWRTTYDEENLFALIAGKTLTVLRCVKIVGRHIVVGAAL